MFVFCFAVMNVWRSSRRRTSYVPYTDIYCRLWRIWYGTTTRRRLPQWLWLRYAVSFARGSALKWVLCFEFIKLSTIPNHNPHNDVCYVQVILLLVVVLFVIINSILTLFTPTRRRIDPSAAMFNRHKFNNSSGKWSQYGYATKYISIEVLSSRNRVRICVDDVTVNIQSYFVAIFKKCYCYYYGFFILNTNKDVDTYLIRV